jgi:drug/metabolite transporter (DMT)-like permease
MNNFFTRYGIYLLILIGGYIIGRYTGSAWQWLGLLLALLGYIWLSEYTER